MTNISSISLNTQAVNDNKVTTKAYKPQFHNENERNGGDLGLNFYNESGGLVKNSQDNDLNKKKFINSDSITINKNPFLDNEISNKEHVDDELIKNTILRINQTLQNYLKVSVGNYTYDLTRYDKIQLFDVTEIRFPNSGSNLLQKWRIKILN